MRLARKTTILVALFAVAIFLTAKAPKGFRGRPWHSLLPHGWSKIPGPLPEGALYENPKEDLHVYGLKAKQIVYVYSKEGLVGGGISATGPGVGKTLRQAMESKYGRGVLTDPGPLWREDWKWHGGARATLFVIRATGGQPEQAELRIYAPCVKKLPGL
jgi:hypothetical protein